MAGLGNAHGSLGKYPKAKAFLEEYEKAKEHVLEALAINTFILQSYHSVGEVLTNLGYILINLGENDEAKERLKQALSLLENRFGKKHFSAVKVLTLLGKVLINLEEYKKAEEFLVTALAIWREQGGQDCLEKALTLTLLF